MVKVVKRNGSLVDFDKTKISNAILKAMTVGNTINESIANQIADDAECQYKDKEKVSISEIETFVFNELCKYGQQMTAKAYEGYRSIREFQRKASNSIEKQVKELVNGDSDYWNNENSNKNAKLVTTQRDYMAGIISKEITRKYILTPDVVQAHDDGIIHFHDIDYMGQNALTNCCLINLDDMLQYGTVINKVKIDKPHRLITATTLATQIITAVTSSQYGGATITLSHLAPFVRDSFNRYYAKYKLCNCNESECEKFAREDMKKEIEDAVQTFNYQINSMTTTNG